MKEDERGNKMTKKYLYPNKFYDWRGWDFIKWIFGMWILCCFVWIIWSINIGLNPARLLPDQINYIITRSDDELRKVCLEGNILQLLLKRL